MKRLRSLAFHTRDHIARLRGNPLTRRLPFLLTLGPKASRNHPLGGHPFTSPELVSKTTPFPGFSVSLIVLWRRKIELCPSGDWCEIECEVKIASTMMCILSLCLATVLFVFLRERARQKGKGQFPFDWHWNNFNYAYYIIEFRVDSAGGRDIANFSPQSLF